MPAGPGDERATGGVITYDGEYVNHLFLTSGTFTPIDGLIEDAEYFAVGGGPGSSGGVNGVRYGAASSGAQVLTGLIDIPNAPQPITVGAASNGTVGSVTPAAATATTIGALVTALPGVVAPHTTSNGANSPNGFTGGVSPGGTGSGGGAGAGANGSGVNGGLGVASSLPTGALVVYGSAGGSVGNGGTPNGTGGTGAGNGNAAGQGGHATTRGSSGGGGNSTSGGGNGQPGLAFIRYLRVVAPPTNTLMKDVDIWLHDFKQVRSMQIQQCKDYKIERFLQGSEQLSFRLQLTDPKLEFMHEDQLVFAEGAYWYIDHFEDAHPGDKLVICNARHITELTWRVKFGNFSILAQTPAAGLALILAGSGWTTDVVPGSIQLYTMEEIDASTLTLLRRWAAITGYELAFNTVTKKVSMVAQIGTEQGIGFRWGHSLKEVRREFYPPPATRLYPVGANNLTVSNVNPTGLPYIEDYSFYEAQGLTLLEARDLYRKDLTWVDERYLLSVNLYDAAVARLAKLSQPRVFYSAKVLDLSRIMQASAYGYAVGDTTVVDDEVLGVLEHVRVTRTVQWPKDPKKDEVELGFLTNGLLDVSDGGNRAIDYDNMFMIVDINNDPLVIGGTTNNYNTIALTSAGAASILTGSTFVGTATGTGTIEWRMVVDGTVIGKAYSKAFTNGELVEFSWPSLATDLPEGAHVVDWRAQVVSGSGTVSLLAEHGRSWVLSRGAVGVGINASPNAFVSEAFVDADMVVVVLSDDVNVDMVNTPITPGSPFVSGTVDEAFVDADMPVVTLDENFVIPFRLEDAVFGQLDSIYVLSGPNEPSDLGFQQYHPPAGLSSDGNKNFGPGTLTEPTTYLGLITAQAGTNYWPLKVARADGVGEPDQIGTDHMTMRSGNSTLSAGQGPNGVDCIQLIEADSEYYETTNSVDWASTWSISFWHKMATAASTVPILMSTGTASTNGWYLIHRDDRSGLTNQFTVSGSTYYMDFGTLDRNIEADGLWHHIAVTRQYNATATLDTFRLYLDGIKVATATRATIGNVDMGVSKLSLGDRLPATGSTLTCPGQYVHAARALGTVWSDAQVAQQAFWSGV